MRRLLRIGLLLGLGLSCHGSSQVAAARIFGLPGAGSDRAIALESTPLNSDAIHSPGIQAALRQSTASHAPIPANTVPPALTASATLHRRQEESTTEACTAPSTALFGQASCLPFVADTTAWLCGTSTSTKVGCNIGTGTTSTTSISTTSVTARCAQTGCSTCLSVGDTPSTPTATLACANCSTTGGLVYAAPITILPSNYTSGQLPVQTTVPVPSTPDQLRRSVDTEGTPISSSPLKIFERFAQYLPEGVRRLYYDVLASKTQPEQTASESAIVESLQLAHSASSHAKRSLLTPQDYPGGHDEFMLMEVSAAEDADMMVYARPDGTDGRTSAKVRPYRTEAFNAAQQGLNGCTAIAIVARGGVWLGHAWENPSFFDSQLFIDDVLIGIFEGDDSGWLPGINTYAHDASLFNTLTFGETQNVVQPIIITPYINPNYWGDPTRPWRFMHEVQALKSILRDAFHVEPIVFPYHLLDQDDASIVAQKLETTAHGRLVIQYEPRQYLPTDVVTDTQGQQHQCVKQYSTVRVYADVEQQPIYEDTWIAMPDQATLWKPDSNTQQILKRHEIETRGEDNQIVIYGCVKLITNETTSSCTSCTSNATCSINPDDDQGQDGFLPTNSTICPFCTSDTCGLNPNDDQGEDGTAPKVNGTSPWPFWPNGTNSSTTPIASTTSPPCSLITMPGGVINNNWEPSSAMCACGSTTSAPVTTTAANGSLALMCGNSTVTTNGTTSTTGLSGCSITTQWGQTYASVTVSAYETCACAGGHGADPTTFKANGTWYVGCQDGTATQTLSTAGIPGITSCNITAIPDKTTSGTTKTGGVSCYCNDDWKVPAFNSSVGVSIAYACPTKTPFPVPVTTLPATPALGCTPQIVSPITVAASNLGTTTYPGHWTCGCQSGVHANATTTSLAPHVAAVGCVDDGATEPTFATTTIEAPTSCVTHLAKTGEGVFCACDVNYDGTFVTTSGARYCSFPGYTPTNTQESTIPGPTLVMPYTVETGLCHLHLEQWVKPQETINWDLNIWPKIWDWNDIVLYGKDIFGKKFPDNITLNTRYDGSTHFPRMTENLSMMLGIHTDRSWLKRDLSNGTNVKLPAPPHPVNDKEYTTYDKVFKYGDVSWFSNATKDDVGPHDPYCSVGEWYLSPYKGPVIPELGLEQSYNTQDLDCWFECTAVLA